MMAESCESRDGFVKKEKLNFLAPAAFESGGVDDRPRTP
jgi:hypothetical protein